MSENHLYTCQRQWIGHPGDLLTGHDAIQKAVGRVSKPVFIVDHDGLLGVSHNGTMVYGEPINDLNQGRPLMGFAPALHLTDLGDPTFKADLGLKYAYIAGAMANGITSVEMVAAAGQSGMVGFFGAGGLTLDQVEAAIHRLRQYPTRFPFGFNLIHSPNDPDLEMAMARLYIKRGISLVSASAYIGLTLPLVYYRVKGIHQDSQGRIVCPNHVVAKVSRIEVARKFFAPPPAPLLDRLVQMGKISSQEAELARHVPMAQDITAEADSGGHTDNRPAMTLLPTFLAFRSKAADEFGFNMPLRVGLAGGIATPDAVAAAFSMGAAYVLTGSINQAAVEADTSETVRNMLAQAQQADVTMAPAADMFELGARVQVLKRGTMFAMRAAKLYSLYSDYDSYDDIPAKERDMIERGMLRASFEDAWHQTRQFFEDRDPAQIERAEKKPKHKMALVFRSYLGQASLWAKQGVPDRQIDYQIWCGPSMGAFNTWVKGSFLESIHERKTVTMAMNLLYGAAGLMRCQWLRSQGATLPAAVFNFKPLAEEDILERLK